MAAFVCILHEVSISRRSCRQTITVLDPLRKPFRQTLAQDYVASKLVVRRHTDQKPLGNILELINNTARLCFTECSLTNDFIKQGRSLN